MAWLNPFLAILPFIGFSVQIGGDWCLSRKVGAGKIFTMPLRKRLAYHAIKRRNTFLLVGCANGKYFRCMQLLPILIGCLPVLFINGDARPMLGYWILVIILYLDDFLSTWDKPNKWLKTAKNKLKWRMKLPVLNPVPTVGG